MMPAIMFTSPDRPNIRRTTIHTTENTRAGARRLIRGPRFSGSMLLYQNPQEHSFHYQRRPFLVQVTAAMLRVSLSKAALTDLISHFCFAGIDLIATL